MGKIEKILKKGPVEGQTTEVYPVTSTKAVYDENNKRLDNIITRLQESVYLNTPIPISTEDTPEAKAQNVKNITDYVEKAKAAGIISIDGMSVTCIIDGDYSAVGYLYRESDFIGILLYDDFTLSYVSIINGIYDSKSIIIEGTTNQVNSYMLVQGARRPIILTPDTTEVDEETYQKLLSDDVDVIFKAPDGGFCALTYIKSDDSSKSFYFSCFSYEDEIYIYAYIVSIATNAPHTCTLSTLNEAGTFNNLINEAGYLNKSTLNPVLQEIDLTGTDADRKAKLDKFKADWKVLTGADNLDGARFVGYTLTGDGDAIRLVLTYNPNIGSYVGVNEDENNIISKCEVNVNDGSLTVTPSITVDTTISDTSMNPVQNKVIKAYIDGLVGNVAVQLAQI